MSHAGTPWGVVVVELIFVIPRIARIDLHPVGLLAFGGFGQTAKSEIR